MINRNHSLKNLIELDFIFRKNKVCYWLQDGTLLGYYRDQDFISHDNDVDIGIRWTDFSQKVMIEVLDNGFEFRAASGLTHNSLVVNIVKRGVSIDFYFYYDATPGYFYHSAILKKPFSNGRKRIDFTYKKFGIKEVEFLKHNFFVPEDELYFIKTKYGPTWAKKDTEWNSSVDPLNRSLTDITIKKKRSLKDFNEWLYYL